MVTKSNLVALAMEYVVAVHAKAMNMDLKRYGTRDWGWYIAFGILAVICSLLILWQPAIGAMYAVYMISFAFLIIGFFRIMLSFELKNLHKRGRSMRDKNEEKEIPVG